MNSQTKIEMLLNTLDEIVDLDKDKTMMERNLEKLILSSEVIKRTSEEQLQLMNRIKAIDIDSYNHYFGQKSNDISSDIKSHKSK